MSDQTVEILEVNETQLETVERGLGAIPECLKSATMALRGCYTTEASSVQAFIEFKRDLMQHAMVFKGGLLPLSIKTTSNMKSFFDNYLALEFEEWRDEIEDIAKEAQKYQELCAVVATAYTILATDLKKQEGSAEIVVGTLRLEAQKFQEEAAVHRGKQDAITDYWQNKTYFLFVPVIGWAFIPSALRDYREWRSEQVKAIAAESEEKMAAAATMTVTDTLIPAILQFINIMEDLAGFFKVLNTEVQAFSETGEDALQDKKKRHFKLMHMKASGIQEKCTQFIAVTPAIESDLDCINVDQEDNYVQQWLKDQTMASGKSLWKSIVDRGCSVYLGDVQDEVGSSA